MEKELTKEEKAKRYDKVVEDRRRYTYRRFIWTTLMIKKGEDANLTVSEHEVDVEIKRREEKK